MDAEDSIPIDTNGRNYAAIETEAGQLVIYEYDHPNEWISSNVYCSITVIDELKIPPYSKSNASVGESDDIQENNTQR